MNGKQKKFLRGLAHDMNPTVHIGHRGLTESVSKQIDDALTDHELIKIRVTAESPIDRREAADQLADKLNCEVAGSIGRVVIVYRANPDAPKITLPAAPGAAVEVDDEDEDADAEAE